MHFYFTQVNRLSSDHGYKFAPHPPACTSLRHNEYPRRAANTDSDNRMNSQEKNHLSHKYSSQPSMLGRERPWLTRCCVDFLTAKLAPGLLRSHATNSLPPIRRLPNSTSVAYAMPRIFAVSQGAQPVQPTTGSQRLPEVTS